MELRWIKLKCKKCNHIWNYKGKSKIYVTCPHCYSKIKILIIEKEVKK